MRVFLLAALGCTIVLLATTGFDCASPEVVSAKLDYSQKQYDKARTLLEQEVRKNPHNEEAWYYLALVAHEQADHFRVADACDSAELAGSTYRDKIENLRGNEWVDCWNDAVRAYNNAGDNADSLKKSAYLFRAAFRLDSTDHEPQRLLGTTYLAMQDTAQALHSLLAYIGAVNDNVQQGIAAGLTTGEPESQILHDLGKPDAVKSIPTSDSTLRYDYHGKKLIAYTAAEPNAGGARTLLGWMFYRDMPPATADNPLRITAVPYNLVGNIFYQRGSAMMLASSLQSQNAQQTDSSLYYKGVAEMDTALTYFSTAQRLNPADEYASTMLSEIYLRTNQLAQAKSSYEELIKRFPKNKYTRVNFGILLLKQNQYADAVAQLNQALTIDPTYSLALYYTAIAYKNWSADIQAAARNSGKKETPEERNTYLGKLRTSAEYFEKLHTLSPNDYEPLGQLAEIYAILQENAKIKSTLDALVNMQQAQNDNPDYWNTLGKIYTVLDDVPKAQSAFDKAEALQKK